MGQGASKVETLRADLKCLECGYSLRGLAGDVVTCPECGVQYDVASLVAGAWHGPWYSAPDFNRLLMPVTWLIIAGLAWLASALVASVSITSGLSVGAAVGILAVWLFLLWRLRNRMPGHRAISLALLAHALVGGYVAGVAGVMTVICPGSRLTTLGGGSVPMMGVIFAILGMGLIVLCRLGERYVARCCIRNYLKQRAAPTTPIHPPVAVSSTHESRPGPIVDA